MNSGEVEVDGGLPSLQYLANQIPRGSCDTVDFFSSTLSYSNAEILLAKRTSPDFYLNRELSEGRALVHTKTDCLHRYCAVDSKHTSYIYNQFASPLVENYENRASAQSAKYCFPSTRGVSLGAYGILIGGGLESVFRRPTNYMGGDLRAVSFSY